MSTITGDRHTERARNTVRPWALEIGVALIGLILGLLTVLLFLT